MSATYRPMLSRGPHKLHAADPKRPGRALCGYRGLPVGSSRIDGAGVCRRCQKAAAQTEGSSK